MFKLARMPHLLLGSVKKRIVIDYDGKQNTSNIEAGLGLILF